MVADGTGTNVRADVEASPGSMPAAAAIHAGPVLSVRGLTVLVGAGHGRSRPVVADLSFDLGPRETLCIAGESGSGKSMTALAIMGLLPRPGAKIGGGGIALRGRELTTLPESAMRRIRGDRIAMIFQEPMTSLNPVLTVGRQLTEAIAAHAGAGPGKARALALEALEAVRLSEPQRRLAQYPHELSGGMRQRVMIAMATVLKPDVLIADEPTTALDVTVQAQILQLLRDLRDALGTAIILITHDMGVVAEMADRVIVMRSGRVVEERETLPLFEAPREAYTRDLLAAVPRIGAGREAASAAAGHAGRPGEHATAGAVVSVRDLAVGFDLKGGILGRARRRVHAVEGVSFDIAPDETFALVGESGCGKSTTAKALAGLVPYAGTITIAGRNAAAARGREAAKAVRRDIQMVFQDPFASLDPRMTVGDLVAEPMLIHGIADAGERRERTADLFRRVGLSPDDMRRYPHQFSGGQRQRICVARALSLRPKVIIADESVSALDVSVQARVLRLLRDLQREFGIAYLFISHDMAVVENISDRVAVMFLGQIVETGTRDQVFRDPRHPYTRRLIEAVPVPDPRARRARLPTLGRDVATPVRAIGDPPARVRLIDIGDGHLVADA